MKLCAFDWEATGTQTNKANPYDRRNKGCCLSIVSYDTIEKEFKPTTWDFEYSSNSPYLTYKDEIEQYFKESAWIGGMNIKYDIAWCNRYGINVLPYRLWDIQLFHFIWMNQSVPYPSLNDIAEYHELPLKIDVVKRDYWEQGLDTDQVPYPLLQEYCEWDTELTLRIMMNQFQDLKRMDKKLQATVMIAMRDIRNLAEMEINGFIYDYALSEKLSQETDSRISQITAQLQEAFGINGFPNDVRASVNLNSNDHLSALLFGGVIKYDTREEYEQTLKSGITKVKTRKAVGEFVCPRLFEPVPKTELKKQGYYSTNEDTLRKIKAPKKDKSVIDLLLELAKLEKLNGTYYKGFPKLLEKMGWDDVVHSGFNQCVTVTGRLSSTRPNLQNVPKIHKPCFKSRFAGGKICNIDFAGLEWRAILEWTQDQAGISEVLDDRDAHTDNQKAFGLPSRLIAKVFLFRAIYRGKAFAYANDPDFMAVSKSAAFWEQVIDNFYKKYSGLAKTHNECIKEVYKTGKYVSPISGRVYPYKKYEKRGVKDYNDSEIVNFPVQGLGADIVAVFRCYLQGLIRKHGLSDRILILATVHDSLVWDVADDEALEKLQELAHHAFEQLANLWKHFYGFRLTVPHGYEVEVGDTYGTAKSVKECKMVLYANDGLDLEALKYL